MKKLIIFLIVILMTSTLYADGVGELQTEAQGLQQRLVQYQQIMSNIQVRIIKIEGIIEYLNEQNQLGYGIR